MTGTGGPHLGEFMATGSPLHRIPAIVKLGVVALYLAAAAWSGGWSLLVLLAGVGLWLFSARVPRRVLRTLSVTLLWFGLITLAAHLILGGSTGIGIPTAWGELLARMGHAGRAWLRAVIALGLLTGLTISTAPVEAAEALTGFPRSRRRRGRRGSLALAIVLVFRFYPLLVEEIQRIRRARQARGARLLGGGWRNSIREWGVVFTAFLGQTLRRADEVCLALEARGYGA